MARQKIVALLDDDPAVLKAVERMVSSYGYSTLRFSSAPDLMAAAAELHFDCLVTDINLGDHCGLDVVHVLSAKGIKTPVIFMTGSSDVMLRQEAMALGCVAYLQKPFKAEPLIAAIKKATGRKVDS